MTFLNVQYVVSQSVSVLADDLAVPLTAKVPPDAPHLLKGVRHDAPLQLVQRRSLGAFEKHFHITNSVLS